MERPSEAVQGNPAGTLRVAGRLRSVPAPVPARFPDAQRSSCGVPGAAARPRVRIPANPESAGSRRTGVFQPLHRLRNAHPPAERWPRCAGQPRQMDRPIRAGIDGRIRELLQTRARLANTHLSLSWNRKNARNRNAAPNAGLTSNRGSASQRPPGFWGSADAPSTTGSKPRPTKIDPYKQYIERRLANYPELSAAQLFREIREDGFPGGCGLVKHHVRITRERRRNGRRSG